MYFFFVICVQNRIWTSVVFKRSFHDRVLENLLQGGFCSRLEEILHFRIEGFEFKGRAFGKRNIAPYFEQVSWNYMQRICTIDLTIQFKKQIVEQFTRMCNSFFASLSNSSFGITQDLIINTKVSHSWHSFLFFPQYLLKLLEKTTTIYSCIQRPSKRQCPNFWLFVETLLEHELQ